MTLLQILTVGAHKIMNFSKIAENFPQTCHDIAAAHHKLLPFFCLLMALALGACSNDFSKVPALTDKAPIPAASSVLPPYRVQIGDVLDLKFRLNPELDETVTVRPDGMISTSMFQDVNVYDRTVKDVNDNLWSLYNKELKDPKVSVIVRSFAPTRIYVGGEVNRPGEFIVIGPPLTLTQAISRAGGILNSADSSNVLILRRGAGDKGKMYMADYDGATQGGIATKDVRLAPYDVVFVPKSGAALTHKYYEQYLQQYVSPSLGATYQLNR